MFGEPVLVVSEGFDRVMAKIAGRRFDEQTFEVWDGGGRELGRVEPTDRDSAASKLFRVLLSLVLLSSMKRDVRGLRVVDASGAPVLALRIEGDILVVRDPAGELVGVVSNESRPGGLDVNFYFDELPRGLRGRKPDPVATFHHKLDRPPFAYEVNTPAGAVIARVSNDADRRNALEILDAPDPRMRKLMVGFVCGMVDRVWLRSAPVPTGGNG